jgi:uncharacterized SAM-binding protein YcdF (DUF218 family)
MTGRAASLAAIGVVLGGLAGAPFTLEATGRFLVVSDPVAPADALYVFPGEIPRRAGCAAELVRAGVARRVVVSGERIPPALAAIGVPLSDAELNARLLREQGIAPETIVVLNAGTSTQEDAEALRTWATAGQGVSRLIAVTSPTHSRRAKRTLGRVFSGTDVDVRVLACPPGLAPEWWRREDTLVQVTDEYLKLLYYVIAH